MVSINYSTREVCCKIVYYGPGLSGKTTNLQYVHSKVPNSSRGKMISLATEADRTLYFDFLPINIGTINGFAAKFQLYTVPGQVYYNATRKLVLRGVDGVVFVADSQPDKMDENIESLLNLEENLKEYGYDINELPMVIQFNKSDLPGILTADELNSKLNPRGIPSFSASATVGNGVFDTLKMIIKMVLEKAKNSASGKTATPQATIMEQPKAESAGQPVAEGYAASKAVTENSEERVSPTVTSNAAETAASSGSVATVEKPVEADDGQFRPYPGSTGKIKTENKITPTSFSPTSTPEPENENMGQKMLHADEENGAKVSSNLNTPSMAPSLKRRNEKKRGFFKRLFGIK